MDKSDAFCMIRFVKSDFLKAVARAPVPATKFLKFAVPVAFKI